MLFKIGVCSCPRPPHTISEALAATPTNHSYHYVNSLAQTIEPEVSGLNAIHMAAWHLVIPQH